MTGVQPRPLRYQGRLNRQGRKAIKLWMRAYGERFNEALDRLERRYSTWRGLGTIDEVRADAFGKTARAEHVRDLFESGRVTIDPPDGCR